MREEHFALRHAKWFYFVAFVLVGSIETLVIGQEETLFTLAVGAFGIIAAGAIASIPFRLATPEDRPRHWQMAIWALLVSLSIAIIAIGYWGLSVGTSSDVPAIVAAGVVAMVVGATATVGTGWRFTRL